MEGLKFSLFFSLCTFTLYFYDQESVFALREAQCSNKSQNEDEENKRPHCIIDFSYYDISRII